MADDNGQFSDDISALWGDQEESALVPPRPETPDQAFEEIEPAPTNGSHAAVVGDPTDEGVARLARALATQPTDVVSRAELERTRTEMQGAFTHQLAVALYDLLGASNDRFGRTEERLDDIGRRLDESVAGHVRTLTAVIEAQQRAAAAGQSAVQAELEALREHLSQRLDRPLDDLATFQRDVRHEIGRLADAVDAHGVEAVRRAEARADDDVAAHRQLTERIDGAATEGAGKLEDLSVQLTSLQNDVADLREIIDELRQSLGTGRRRRRFGRSE